MARLPLLAGLCLVVTWLSGLTCTGLEREKTQYESGRCCSPEQIHLSLVDKPEGNDNFQAAGSPQFLDMMVQWATECACRDSYVRYGELENHPELATHASAITWHHNLGNANGTQWLHRGRINLDQLLKTCFYTVCSSKKCSKTFWTRTPGHLARDRGPGQKFLIFGDLGLESGLATISRLAQAAQTGEYTAMFHAGDIAYDLHSGGGRRGDEFLRRMESAAAYLPYMTVPGNHEAFFKFHPYLNRFTMPVPRPNELDLPHDVTREFAREWPRPVTNASERYEPLFYSIDIGLVHFIGYDTESYYFRPHLRDATRYWLLEDLRKANRRRSLVPWIIAIGHRPMYCSNEVDNECNHKMPLIRREFEEMFYNGGVDLIIQGHEHSYERFYPTFNATLVQPNYVNPRAPVHIISGQTGCSEGFLGMCTNPTLRPRFAWSAYRSWYPGLNGYGRITVTNATHLVWEQVLDHFFQVTQDKVVLLQEHHGSFRKT